MRHVLWQAILGLAVACIVHGCKKNVGSSCDSGESRCLDRKMQLVCDDGVFVATPCQGPAGCLQSELGVSCDISGNQPGSPCARADEGAAACVEDHRMIACRGGQYRSVPCRGPKGCENEAGHALCDASVAALNDVCKDEAGKACTTDGKDVLACTAGAMKLVSHCRGPGGCESKSGKLECDMSSAKLDDPCDKSMEGKNACAIDGSSIVVCRAGKFVVDEKCKAGKRCFSKGGSIECAKEEKPG